MFEKKHDCDVMRHLKRIKEIIEEYEAKDESFNDLKLMGECIAKVSAHIR